MVDPKSIYSWHLKSTKIRNSRLNADFKNLEEKIDYQSTNSYYPCYMESLNWNSEILKEHLSLNTLAAMLSVSGWKLEMSHHSFVSDNFIYSIKDDFTKYLRNIKETMNIGTLKKKQ